MTSTSAALRLPPLQSTAFWSETQWTIFWSLVEAALPPIRDQSSTTDDNAQITISDDEFASRYAALRDTVTNPPSETQFRAFLDHNVAADPAFRDNAQRTIAGLHSSAQKALGAALASLNTRAGCLLLTGYWSPPHQQSITVRHAILTAWRVSRLRSLRALSKAITTLSQKSFLQTSTLFRDLTGYTDLPDDHQPAQGYDFKFRQFDPSPTGTDTDTPEVIDTDIIIVGSGCGGGVCAKILAEAGHRVLVVDKSYHFPPSLLPMPQEVACQHLYENGGLLGTDDGLLNVVAGSCWGGGGTVNWSVALQTQGYVRDEWADDRGLVFFSSSQFQQSLDRVCEYMGVSTEPIVHNNRARFLMDGSRKLGWHASPAPQNTGGEEHDCARCHLGCASGKKKGPATCWLPAAAEAGAEFIEGLHVEEVVFDETNGERRAVGIKAKWTSRDAEGGLSGPLEERTTRNVVVNAKRVIVSAGALQSPLLLMRSGLTNRHIGHHLRLHPTSMIMGIWKEDMTPWQGGTITALNHSFEDLDSFGHGVKLEPTCMVPYAILSNVPWRGGIESKLDALKYRNAGGYIALTRDRDGGRVYPDPVTGRPHIDHQVSAFDRKHTLEGLIALAKICYVEGAIQIYACIPGLEPFIRDNDPSKPLPEDGDAVEGINDPKFKAWLAQMRQVGNSEAGMASAHQMSTCRMAINEDEGVVDPKGRVFGTEALYVADASVLPSASGVNPMVTNMAIADWIANGIVRELGKETVA
ncbi:long chain fatty alcohol oxidase [Plectosphaerella plurivora]|uniref:Long-chain-alcohol oxidase n=1 Tax=Plectosphaerella plurivora TaxID=936078 RepID=A0A9P9AC38_9PEZI|nr:long chain fatty alcohol oxidase [Plectosphaerella plurivora]